MADKDDDFGNDMEEFFDVMREAFPDSPIDRQNILIEWFVSGKLKSREDLSRLIGEYKTKKDSDKEEWWPDLPKHPDKADLAAKQSLITANPPSGAGQAVANISSDNNEIAAPLSNVSIQASPLSEQNENTQLGKDTIQAGGGTRQPITHLDRGISSSPLEQTDIGGVPDAIYNPDDFGLNMELGVYDQDQSYLDQLGAMQSNEFNTPMVVPSVNLHHGLPNGIVNAPVSQGGGVLANIGGAISSAAGSASNFISSGIDSAKNSLGSLPSIWSAGTNAFGSAIEEMMGLSGNRSSSGGNGSGFDSDDFVDAINSLTEAVKNLTAKIDSMSGTNDPPTYDQWIASKNGSSNSPTVDMNNVEDSSRTLQADVLAGISRTLMRR